MGEQIDGEGVGPTLQIGQLQGLLRDGAHHFTRQTPNGLLFGEITQFDFGPQHKQGQTLQGAWQQVAAGDQPDFIGCLFEHHKAGLESPLGVAIARQASMPHGQQQHILRQLIVQKSGCIIALTADDAQMGQGAGPLQGQFWGHGGGGIGHD